ncbi:hypothetical protein RintRC_2360 [Richelia intracellularis]|nr:hypothetical protein RintRC_2360 [Richelia intracellularis]
MNIKKTLFFFAKHTKIKQYIYILRKLSKKIQLFVNFIHNLQGVVIQHLTIALALFAEVLILTVVSAVGLGSDYAICRNVGFLAFAGTG